MCPVFDLKICKGLYEKYLDVKKKFNPDIFFEEPQGLIRIRTTSIEDISYFWATLGYKAPLLFYMLSGTPEYQDLLNIIRMLSADEVKNVYVYNAKTGEQYPLASGEIESVLLAIHVSPLSQLEKKLLSVFNFTGLNEEESDEDGRECQTRTRDNSDKENYRIVISEGSESHIKLSSSEEVLPSQTMKNCKMKSNTELGKKKRSAKTLKIMER